MGVALGLHRGSIGVEPQFNPSQSPHQGIGYDFNGGLEGGSGWRHRKGGQENILLFRLYVIQKEWSRLRVGWEKSNVGKDGWPG